MERTTMSSLLHNYPMHPRRYLRKLNAYVIHFPLIVKKVNK